MYFYLLIIIIIIIITLLLDWLVYFFIQEQLKCSYLKVSLTFSCQVFSFIRIIQAVENI